MKKLALILSVVALMGLGAGSAMAGGVFINGVPLLSDAEWAQQYAKATPVSGGSIPDAAGIVNGTALNKMGSSYAAGTAVRPVTTFGPAGTCFQSPLTDEQWARQYSGTVGSAY